MPKLRSSSRNCVELCLSRPLNVRKQFLLISSFFTTIPSSRPGGRVLDIAKLKLTQPSLVELGLGLRMTIMLVIPGAPLPLFVNVINLLTLFMNEIYVARVTLNRERERKALVIVALCSAATPKAMQGLCLDQI